MLLSEAIRVNWAERVNAAVAYIEANLSGDISPERIARIAGCSSYNFQRLFSFIADKPLSQYVRERRLTLAAFDVVRSEERLIDIALRYGYDSQDAFARAFRQFHGVQPSLARRQAVTLRSCPRIALRNTQQGEMTMEYRVEAWPAFTVAGYRTDMRIGEAFQAVPGLWDELMRDERGMGLFDLLREADMRPEGLLGVIVGGQGEKSDAMRYYRAVTTHVDVPGCARVRAPEGMETVEVPAATWAILEAGGDPKEAVQRVHREFYTQWLPSSGYVLADAPIIESYLIDTQRVWIAIEKEG